MPYKGEDSPQLGEWLDRMAPVVERAQAQLAIVSPDALTLKSGCRRDPDANYRLDFFWKEYIVSAHDFSVRSAKDAARPSSYTQSLILTYMATADGAKPSGRWVGFRDLPNGLFYVQAFQSYTGTKLVRRLEQGAVGATPTQALEAFRSGAERLGGKPFEIGDAGYVFRVFPRVQLAVTYWAGDEEFASQARVLFEDSAAHYMSSDGLAILGSQLVSRVLRATG